MVPAGERFISPQGVFMPKAIHVSHRITLHARSASLFHPQHPFDLPRQLLDQFLRQPAA